MNWKYIITAIVQLIVCSCTKTIEFSNSTAPVLVVEGVISNDSLHHLITLTKTFDSEAKFIEFIDSAEIIVSDGNVDYQFENTEEGYRSIEAFRGVPGSTYELTIKLLDSIGGRDSYEATTRIPNGMNLDSTRLFRKSNDTLSTLLVSKEVVCYGQEPGNTTDFYEVEAIAGKEILTPRLLSQIQLLDDQNFNGQYVSETVLEAPFFLRKETFEDGVSLAADSLGLPIYDTLEVILYSYTNEYYDYLVKVQTQLANAQDFLGISNPIVKPEGNISGSAKGFFSGVYSSKNYVYDYRHIIDR